MTDTIPATIGVVIFYGALLIAGALVEHSFWYGLAFASTCLGIAAFVAMALTREEGRRP